MIEDDGKSITLSLAGASAEIHRYGAHVSSWKSEGGNGGPLEERFFMSTKAVLDGSGPIRGGIPIAFPIFATDIHPDFPNLGGPHGFARISPWSLTKQSQSTDGSSVSITLTLVPTPEIKAFFPHSFRLDYSVSLTRTTLTTGLRILNDDALPFRFNTCLHTYYRVPSVFQARVSPLHFLPFTSRLDPSSPHDLISVDVVALRGETARCYHFPPVKEFNTIFLDYGGDRAGEGVEVVSSGGWTDSVLWNPFATPVSGPIGDLNDGGFRDFVCWEPGVLQELAELEGGGGTWEGKIVHRAI